MYCTNCGKEIPDGSMFCTFCGSSIQGSAPQANGGFYAPPPPPPPKKKKKILPILLGIVAVCIIVAVIGGGKDDSSSPSSSSSSGTSTSYTDPIIGSWDGAGVLTDDILLDKDDMSTSARFYSDGSGYIALDDGRMNVTWKQLDESSQAILYGVYDPQGSKLETMLVTDRSNDLYGSLVITLGEYYMIFEQ